MASNKVFYVTTPIYYANGHPHLGNTYTTTVADSLTRFYRYADYDTFFLTGTDEHGDKVQQAAVAAGKTPQQFTDDVANLFRNTWADLGLHYSRFIRTTEEQHKKVVRDLLQKIYDQGDIYFGEYGGNYCVGCERFLTDKELVDGKCPDHQTVPQFVKEKNYFFRMSKYQDRLIRYITEDCPDFIRPERYKNEVLAMLREPLEDLCISRPKSRLTWGIELPFDPEYVTYVWFDALINYLTGIDYPDGEKFKKFWPAAQHLIAKDIVKPHGVFWPTMLFAAGIAPYYRLNVHGYWVTPTGKMSKSLGNVVNPVTIKQRFGMDVFRYFVFREMVFGLDGSFQYESLETRYNADLANNLGNLVSRSLSMIHKYRDGRVPSPTTNLGELDRSLIDNATSCFTELFRCVENLEIHRGLERVWQLIDLSNVYIDRMKPWALAKAVKTSPEAKEQLDNCLYCLAEVLRVISSLISAFLPETSSKILQLLGYKESEIAQQQTSSAVNTWGKIVAGTMIGKPYSLFPRIEDHSTETEKPMTEAAAENKEDAGLITYEQFGAVALRVGQILEAESVPKSEKLLKLRVDLGEEKGPRQIVAGIAKHYRPEDLVGRKVAVVANLKPAKLMGLLSEGMLLAASDAAGNLELVSIGASIAPGSTIK